MYCNLRPPDAAPVVLRFNYEVDTKFEASQLIRSWLITFLLLIPYVTLWPWPLTLWPWTFCSVSLMCHDQIQYQISAKSYNPRLSYWRLNKLNFLLSFSEGTVIRGVRTELYHKFGWNVSPTIKGHVCFLLISDVFLLSKPDPLKAQISHFLLSVKLKGEMDEMSKSVFRRIIYTPNTYQSTSKRLGCENRNQQILYFLIPVKNWGRVS